ncbi:MAG: ROK family protein [bacterium]|nr:ROK family protein [bacterium]
MTTSAPTPASILAIDFGGTRTRAAWFNEKLELIQRAETLSQVDQPARSVIARMIETARSVIPEGQLPQAIGIAAPGPLDPQNGIIHYVKTIPNWHEVPLATNVSAAFDNAPTFMQNDGNLAVLAEYHLGAAKGADPALYLTVSTGIGGGAIIDGKLFAGARGMAIEPGHLRFTLPGGEIVRWEQLASGTAIGQIARERLARTDAPSILRDIAQVDGQAVGEAARAGDRFALNLIQETGRWLGLGLVNLIHVFNPRVIVIGGSVSTLGELIFAPAREVIQEHVLHPDFVFEDFIRPPHFGDDVCLYGAALYARERLLSS